MSTALLFAALCLASYRVWRLIGRDDITAGLRTRLISESGSSWREYAYKLITCPWCLGSWIAVGATYALHRYVVPLHPHWLLWAVACACVVGFLGMIDEKLSG